MGIQPEHAATTLAAPWFPDYVEADGEQAGIQTEGEHMAGVGLGAVALPTGVSA